MHLKKTLAVVDLKNHWRPCTWKPIDGSRRSCSWYYDQSNFRRFEYVTLVTAAIFPKVHLWSTIAALIYQISPARLPLIFNSDKLTDGPAILSAILAQHFKCCTVHRFIEMYFSKLTNNNQIFRNDFDCIHHHLCKISCQIIECKIFDPYDFLQMNWKTLALWASTTYTLFVI